MPYCLACGTKTDFEQADCPTCGEAIERRIDPPDAADSETPVVEDDADDVSDLFDDEDADSDLFDDEDADSEESLSATDSAGASPFSDRQSLAFAARYPLGDGYRSLAVGGLIELFAVVFPPLSLLTAGYGMALLRGAARGQTEPPSFGDYGQMLTDGMRLVVVLGLYTVVGLLGTVTAAAILAVDEPLGTAAFVAVGVVTLYPLPGSVTVYGATDDLRAAFALGTAGQFVTSGTYLRAWLAWLGGLVVVALTAMLSTITLVGPVVVRAWGTYSLAALWGYYYRRAVARDVVAPAPSDPVP